MPIFIDMPNFEPSVRRCDAAWPHAPCPSRRCRGGGGVGEQVEDRLRGAGIDRSTVTTSGIRLTPHSMVPGGFEVMS